MLQDKIFFKLNPVKGIKYFHDRELNVTLLENGKIAHWCYFRMTPRNIFVGLLNETIIQITEAEYNALYPPTKWFKGGAKLPDDGDDGDNLDLLPGSNFILMFGVSVPDSSLGKIGDFYFRTYQKGQVYEKTTGGWTLRFDFAQSHRLMIPFEDVSFITVPWTSERRTEFPGMPIVQCWLYNVSTTLYEITTVPISFVGEPSTFTEFTVNLGGLYKGILVIS